MINSSYLTLPRRQERSWLQDLMIVVGASFLIALVAQIKIPLPFTPVPIVLYTQVILMLSVVLGSQRAVAAVSLFLLEGAMGLPVFAGGSCGFLHLVGPTGGYLIGFLLAAFVTGYLSERLEEKKGSSLFSVMGIGNLIIFACGVTWLSQFVGWKGAVMLGFVPFIIPDFLKLILTTAGLNRLVGRSCRGR